MSESDSHATSTRAFTFGRRLLDDHERVWEHNAWDNVTWSAEHLESAAAKIAFQKEHPVDDFDRNIYLTKPVKYWDIFYRNNQAKFFKDRKWLVNEFPELLACTQADAGKCTLIEVGCGAGNSFFPILESNENRQLRLHAVDFSPRAVQLVKENDRFVKSNAQLSASVWDLANDGDCLPVGIDDGSVDIVLLVFVFSALAPAQWRQALSNLSRMLKPGGTVVFRDYGRYDMAQLRFKKGRLLDDNFYCRGDGTRVYFFEEDELRALFEESFLVDKLGVDKRLLVNRKRQLQMYRCWLQARFLKL